ncbi:MAG: PspC domain-containing protein [Candidatus Zixiibacteriota bacterium]|nr:MAG: PspC domain-containing protein [candidate division Zixibacteria bacterium]
MQKKIYRSRTNSMIAGICGGLGEYLSVDPTIIRVVAVLLIIPDGIGLLAYIIGWVIIPRRPEMEAEMVAPERSERSQLLPGLALILIGLIFLLNNLIPWFDIGYLWPLILIVLGVALLLKAHKRETPS